MYHCFKFSNGDFIVVHILLDDATKWPVGIQRNQLLLSIYWTKLISSGCRISVTLFVSVTERFSWYLIMCRHCNNENEKKKQRKKRNRHTFWQLKVETLNLMYFRMFCCIFFVFHPPSRYCSSSSKNIHGFHWKLLTLVRFYSLIKAHET